MAFIEKIKWYHILIFILVISVLFCVFYCIYCQKKEPFSATEEQNTKKSPIVAEIVLYYTTWCGYSRSFLPEWEKFEGQSKDELPFVRVSRVRCEDGNETTCNQKGIEGFPTVMLYLENGTEILFEGERSANSLISFVKSNVKPQ